MRKNRKRRARVELGLELADDDAPDGAFFAMAADFAGMDSGEFFDELACMEIDDAPPCLGLDPTKCIDCFQLARKGKTRCRRCQRKADKP